MASVPIKRNSRHSVTVSNVGPVRKLYTPSRMKSENPSSLAVSFAISLYSLLYASDIGGNLGPILVQLKSHFITEQYHNNVGTCKSISTKVAVLFDILTCHH